MLKFAFILITIISRPVTASEGVLEKISKAPEVLPEKTQLDHELIESVEVYDQKTKNVFRVATRTKHMERFPCDHCHPSIKDKQARFAATGQPQNSIKVVRTGRKSHWDVIQEHPSQFSCSTCHQKNGGLLNLNGETVGFDHSYRLCGQCHFQQRKDWEHGAHGKRLTGWMQVRVIENCTGCHNPHNPKFKVKRPAVNFTLPFREDQ